MNAIFLYLKQLSTKEISKKDEIIIYYLLNHAKENTLQEITIRRSANYLKVSPSYIIRLSKQLGFLGFNSLKESIMDLYMMHSLPHNKNYQSSNIMGTITEHLGFCNYLAEQSFNLSKKEIFSLISFLQTNKNIIIHGEGVSNLLAKYLSIELSKMGIMLSTIEFVSSKEIRENTLKQTNGIILVSKSGETGSIIEIAHLAKTLNIPIISITSHQPNTLLDLANTNIKIMYNKNNEVDFYKSAQSSYDIVAFLVIDSIIKSLILTM